MNLKHIKKLLTYIPPSSQVHRLNNHIFDRNEDGDLDITNNTNLVSQMYIRKQNSYTENRIYPLVTLKEHLRSDLITKAKKLAVLNNNNHPWLNMSDMELMQSMQLYRRDLQTGKTGFTLAAILLFGKDEVILNILPHYKTDAILRNKNIDRYDDREIIKTNLIESYEKLMEFVAKHLPNPFYQDETSNRISLRDKIFREVISNILVHREYSNPYPSKLIIETNQVVTENGNCPHFHGVIDSENFSPFPKNPILASFFREVGRAEELGSGVRNLFRYTRIYSEGADPKLIENDVFKIIVPLDISAVNERAISNDENSTPQVPRKHPASTLQVEAKNLLLEFCKVPRSRTEIQEFMGFDDREYFRISILKPLLESRGLLPTIPDKLTSSKQKYYTNPENAYFDISTIHERAISNDENSTPQVPRKHPASTLQVEAKNLLLDFCKIPRSRTEIQEFMGFDDREYFRISILKSLLESRDLLQTIPDKPTSSKQKYYTNSEKHKL